MRNIRRASTKRCGWAGRRASGQRAGRRAGRGGRQDSVGTAEVQRGALSLQACHKVGRNAAGAGGEVAGPLNK